MSSKLRSIRAGHRSVISRLLKKFEDIRDDGDEPVNTEELTKIVNNLLKKQETLQKLNEDILENLDEGEVEAEIVDSDDPLMISQVMLNPLMINKVMLNPRDTLNRIHVIQTSVNRKLSFHVVTLE
ncbi:Hypothetical predicted protein [Mytilus galloprovincialis]|uniref:Uncharacterized protein n=1 Tax=Mytilus galloprovincialis TaxID=29158 RepID=A0A8B6DVQ0_MYTGA|nr:Hypothetical predicted protein [Mytilus galloprovincialis]